MQKVHRFSESLDSAKEILSQNGNRITLMAAFLMVGVTCLFYRLLAVAFFAVMSLPGVGGAFWNGLFIGIFVLLITLFTLLFLLPLLQGIFWLAGAMVGGSDAPLAAIFDPFCEKETYLRCVAHSLGPALRFAGIAGVVLFVGSALEAPSFVVTVLLIVGELLFAMALPNFPLGYFAGTQKRMLWRDAKRKARSFFRINPFCGFRFWTSFLPHILLGILTVGIYLLAHVLPLMVLTCFCECKRTHELMTHLEDKKDHE